MHTNKSNIKKNALFLGFPSRWLKQDRNGGKPIITLSIHENDIQTGGGNVNKVLLPHRKSLGR
jgi:hypothetical protein